MTASYLTTDIIVIVVLIVVLVFIGVAAFLIHFYWTKIGVAEIWNTAKWSSMRSSVYRTMRRFSRTSSTKHVSERPFSAASVFSDDSDGSALPAPLRNNKKAIVVNYPSKHPTKTQSPTPPDNNVRRNSINQVQPVTTIAYKAPVKENYGKKIGPAPKITKIYKIGEKKDEASVNFQTHRF